MQSRVVLHAVADEGVPVVIGVYYFADYDAKGGVVPKVLGSL